MLMKKCLIWFIVGFIAYELLFKKKTVAPAEPADTSPVLV